MKLKNTMLYITLWLAGIASAFAGQTSVSYLFGTGYAVNETRHIIEVQSVGAGKYHRYLFNLDLQDFPTGDVGVFNRIVAHAGRMEKDNYHLATQLVTTNGYSEKSVGAGVILSEKVFVGVDVYRTYVDVKGSAYDGHKIFAYLNHPIGYGLFVDGFIDYTDTPFYDKPQLLTQLALMVGYKAVHLGVELQHQQNRGGVDGVNETVPQLKVKYFF